MTQQIQGDVTLRTLKKQLALSLNIAADNTLTLDFAKVGQIDSSLLSYVLHIIRQASVAGHALSLRNLPANFTELAKLYGIDELLQPYLG